MARLVRDRDGEGHYGSVLNLIPANLSDSMHSWDGNPESLLGFGLYIGTVTGGMFSSRDWWCTTEITEIVSEDVEKIRFKTVNGSTYTLFK